MDGSFVHIENFDMAILPDSSHQFWRAVHLDYRYPNFRLLKLLNETPISISIRILHVNIPQIFPFFVWNFGWIGFLSTPLALPNTFCKKSNLGSGN